MNYEQFKNLGLSEDVLKAIELLGFEKPSKIQKEIIPFILDGYDVVGQAQTGTGKTLAFAASVLSKIEHNIGVKTIVITPTRELALQIYEEFETINKITNFNVLAVFGGSSIDLQIRSLRKGVDIVVGTPGRVMDLIKRKILKLNDLQFFVLDEADEMLNMGFEEDIKSIFESTNKEKQVLLFSATMPRAIKILAEKYMKKDYKSVAIAEKSTTAINVSQNYYLVNDRMRTEALCRVIDQKCPKLAIIFCQRKCDVDKLLTELSSKNYSAEALHGDIVQNMRTQTLNRFKKGAFTYLIATDVAARGIHIDDIDLVINYNLPQDVESYIHRIGRTGRAGKMGEAISFITPREINFLQEVSRRAKCEINKQELPNITEIYKAKYLKIIASVNEHIDNNKYEETLSYVRDMNKEDLLKFAAATLKCMFDKEIGSDFGKEIVIKERTRSAYKQSGNKTRVFLTIGKMDGIRRDMLFDFLNKTTGIKRDAFSNLEIMTKFTFLDVNNDETDKLIQKVYNKKLNNRLIRAERAKKR
ncbi:MAG: DEAD/DEAH box helicase [Bacilli bacterium]